MATELEELIEDVRQGPGDALPLCAACVQAIGGVQRAPGELWRPAEADEDCGAYDCDARRYDNVADERSHMAVAGKDHLYWKALP